MVKNESIIDQGMCPRAQRPTLHPPSGKWGLTSMLRLMDTKRTQSGGSPDFDAVEKQPQRLRLTLYPPSGKWMLTRSFS